LIAAGIALLVAASPASAFTANFYGGVKGIVTASPPVVQNTGEGPLWSAPLVTDNSSYGTMALVLANTEKGNWNTTLKARMPGSLFYWNGKSTWANVSLTFNADLQAMCDTREDAMKGAPTVSFEFKLLDEYGVSHGTTGPWRRDAVCASYSDGGPWASFVTAGSKANPIVQMVATAVSSWLGLRQASVLPGGVTWRHSTYHSGGFVATALRTGARYRIVAYATMRTFTYGGATSLVAFELDSVRLDMRD
jgi:hypothetical protein